MNYFTKISCLLDKHFNHTKKSFVMVGNGRCYLLALLTNIQLVKKCTTASNALAYNKKQMNYSKKSFCNIWP